METVVANDLESYVCPANLTLVSLKVEDAWEALTEKEKRYAYHFARASWAGQLITAMQVSPESPKILKLVFHIFHDCDLSLFGESCESDQKTAGYWSPFLDYCCFCVGNLGNYKTIGDSKVIPALPLEAFAAIVAKRESSDAGLLWEEIQETIYSVEAPLLQFGFPPDQFSQYCLGNVTQDDAELANRFLATKGYEAWNTRLEKRSDGALVIRKASVETVEVPAEDFEGCSVVLASGDHSPELRNIVNHLGAARQFCSGELQDRMIENLQKHFQNGDIEMHKEASRNWVIDSAPTIETTIGFIETDRDPAGVRAEFEGFVAIVNKDISRKFGVLVSRAEDLLQRLPWSSEFEKDKFIKPDFTSLDVIAFCSGCLPLGICLPNYDDVRTSVGFKNVDLGNVCTARSPDAYCQFLSLDDAKLFTKMYAQADQVLTGLHELIGHGSGKLLREEKDGTLNYAASELVNPCTGCVVDSHYKPGETYGTVFGSIASAMEECRAECVSLYLGVEADIQSIFGFEGQACEDSIYAGWLGMCWLGLRSLEHYDPVKTSWGAVHGRARYAILRQLLRASNNEQGKLLTYSIDEQACPRNVTLSMDRSLIRSVGHPAIGDLLLRIQVARCTAAPSMADQFEELTEVPKEFLVLREIVLGRKRPRDIFVQPTIVLDEATDGVTLKAYPATREGLLQGFVDRFELQGTG